VSAIALGYIRNPRADWGWFALLPFVAVAVALGFHHWLPFMAQAGIAVWVTVPHHYATWIRTYGLEDDFARWRGRLVWGPLLLVPTVVLGAGFAPVTLAIVLMLWDHQHSVMQQYGFARVYGRHPTPDDWIVPSRGRGVRRSGVRGGPACSSTQG